MKKFFRLVMALTLTCGAFAITGCNDYEEDINALNQTVNDLSTGKIADMESQISQLNSALDAAETTIGTLSGAVSTLESSLATLTGTTIPGLESRIAAVEALEGELDALSATVETIRQSLSDYATKDYVDATFATKDAVATLETALGTLTGTVTTLSGDLTTLQGQVSTLEGNYTTLSTTLATVQSDLATATQTANQAKDDAAKALGEIESLKKALKTYATIAYVDAEVAALDTKVDSVDAAINQTIKDQVAALQAELDKKLNKDEFETEFNKCLDAALAADGKITEAINTAIKTATDSIWGAINDILVDIDAINDKIDALTGKVSAIAERVQSLVFVPEYSDGQATRNNFVINGVPVSDNVVIDATFKVTPVELDTVIINNPDSVFVYVIPVKTRAAEASTFAAKVADSTLVLTPGAEKGYIDAKIIIPSTAFTGDFAFAMYVGSAAPAATGDAIADIDAGNYVSSDYVTTYNAPAVDLLNAYVLYNPVADREYPAGAITGPTTAEITLAPGVAENEVNVYKRAWSYPQADRAVSFYKDNSIDADGAATARDGGEYTIHLNIGGDYMTIEEVAEMLQCDTSALNLRYNMEYTAVEYTSISLNNGTYAENKDLVDGTTTPNPYFTVDEVDPYGATVDMTKVAGMTDIISSYVLVKNTFSFSDENVAKYGIDVAANPDANDIIYNEGAYIVINEPVIVTIQHTQQTWSYLGARNRSDNPSSPTKPDVNAFVAEGYFTAENVGENDDLVTYLTTALANAATTTQTVTLNGTALTNGPQITLGNITDLQRDPANPGTVTGKLEVTYSSGYEFSRDRVNKYAFHIEGKHGADQKDIIVDYTVDFAQRLGDVTITYDNVRDINFMLPGSGQIDYIALDSLYTKALAALQAENERIVDESGFGMLGWFGHAQVKELLEVNDTTYYTSKVGDTYLYGSDQGGVENPATAPYIYTRLIVTPEAEAGAPTDSSYIRVSSSQITAVGETYSFKTEIDTWLGSRITFIAESEVAAPNYTLNYIPTNIHGFVAGNDVAVSDDSYYVQLDYEASSTGIYNLHRANVADYFKVASTDGKALDANGASFGIKLTANTAESAPAYQNVPDFSTLAPITADATTGVISDYTIDWTSYTARDLNITATLVAAADPNNIANGIEIASLDLNIQTYPLVTSFGQKTTADTGYNNTAITVETHEGEDYIVIERDSNFDLRINLWEYLTATGRFSSGANFIPYEQGGNRHTSIVYLNGNAAMRAYGAELAFGTDYNAVTAGVFRTLSGYDSTAGTLTYSAQDGEIANPLYITIPVTLTYYLDYGHVTTPVTTGVLPAPDATEQTGAFTTDLRIVIKDR